MIANIKNILVGKEIISRLLSRSFVQLSWEIISVLRPLNVFPFISLSFYLSPTSSTELVAHILPRRINFKNYISRVRIRQG